MTPRSHYEIHKVKEGKWWWAELIKHQITHGAPNRMTEEWNRYIDMAGLRGPMGFARRARRESLERDRLKAITEQMRELSPMHAAAAEALTGLCETMMALVRVYHSPRRRIARGLRKAIRRTSGITRARLKEAGLRRQLNTRA